MVTPIDSPAVTPMTDGQRADLRTYLLSSGIAGETNTPRDNCVANAIKLADGDPDKSLGLGPRGRDAESVMQAVADLCGCSPSLDEREGGGVIDPDLVIDALVAVEDRLVLAAEREERVLMATGHPTGLLALYQAIGRALTGGGARLQTPLHGVRLEPPRTLRRKRSVLYPDGVGVLAAGADLVHTHESWPMEALLAEIEPPDLVLADHGWAGAAIARGIETACFTDVNDPAIAVAKADGLVRLVVPCDDNLPPVHYEPVRDFLVGRIRVRT